MVDGLTPDVTVLREWYTDSEGRIEVPVLILDSHSNLPANDAEVLQEKDLQMRKYSKICDALLVTPEGFAHRSYVTATDGSYKIISFNVLPLFLKCMRDELRIERREEMVGMMPEFVMKPVHDRFELELRKNVDRCPECKSEASPMSLIYCSHWDIHFHSQYLDQEHIEHGVFMKTHAECEGCELYKYGLDYEQCSYADLTFKCQCNECGAVFEPETRKVVKNFHPDHFDMLLADTTFYTRKMG